MVAKGPSLMARGPTPSPSPYIISVLYGAYIISVMLFLHGVTGAAFAYTHEPNDLRLSPSQFHDGSGCSTSSSAMAAHESCTQLSKRPFDHPSAHAATHSRGQSRMAFSRWSLLISLRASSTIDPFSREQSPSLTSARRQAFESCCCWERSAGQVAPTTLSRLRVSDNFRARCRHL